MAEQLRPVTVNTIGGVKDDCEQCPVESKDMRPVESEKHMRNRQFMILLSITILLLACSLPGFEAATGTVPTLIVTGAVEETTTPIDTAVATVVAPPPVVLVTATPVIVATPSVPTITPNAVNVNCRSGPDLAYTSVSVLPFGSATTVAGRTAYSSWWYVKDPSNPTGFCWIAADVVTIAGPTAAIPVLALPAAIANKVTVAVSVSSTIVCDGPNPVNFTGTISTNGTTTVQYQWEITGRQTNTTSPQTLVFAGAGTQQVTTPGAYNVDCGEYVVTLHVLSPNDISASNAFTVAVP